MSPRKAAGEETGFLPRPLREGEHSLGTKMSDPLFSLPFKKFLLRPSVRAGHHGETAANGTDGKFLLPHEAVIGLSRMNSKQKKCIIHWIREWYLLRGENEPAKAVSNMGGFAIFARVAIPKNSKKPMAEPRLLY